MRVNFKAATYQPGAYFRHIKTKTHILKYMTAAHMSAMDQ